MSAALDYFSEEHVDMDKQIKNDPDLYLWVMGWIAEQYRGNASLAEVGQAIEYKGKGISGSGYKKMEDGESANLRRWWLLFEHYEVDVVSILSVVRVLVRAIQEEESALSRETTSTERERIVHELYAMFKK